MIATENKIPEFTQYDSDPNALVGSNGRVPPYSLEAEMSVLGAMLMDSEAIAKAIETLDDSFFYKPAHRKIFQAIVSLYERNEEADLITVGNALRQAKQFENVGGAVYLANLMDYAVTPANISYHANIVHEKGILRKLIHASTDIITAAYEDSGDVQELLDVAEQSIFNIASNRVKKGFIGISDMLMQSFEELEELARARKVITGEATGFTDLDRMTTGFHPGDLIIIAGRPSMGKTSFALDIARYVAIENKVPVGFFSLEMSKEQLVRRMLCAEARINLYSLISGQIGSEGWNRLSRAAAVLQQSQIFIDDTATTTVLEMRAKARRLQAEHGKLGLIIVDYLQLAHSHARSESRVQEVSTISRGLKALAKELNCPVVALSQLSRAVEARGGDKRPQLADLRDSGSIEQDADLVMFVYREERYNPDTPNKGIAEIIIGKQRNGPIGTIELAFHGDYTRFDNLMRENTPFEGSTAHSDRPHADGSLPW